MRSEDSREWLGLVGWLALTFAVAWFGSRFEPGPWYAGLTKPSWTPPSWLFGPVWSVLYALMAVAAWWVWRPGGFARAPVALGLFLLQLALNGAWSWLFFGQHRVGAAAVEIVVLWLVILATTVAFWRLSRPAGALLLPYLAWVAYAAALNLSIWRLNS